MQADYFDSSTISTVLAWVCSIPTLIVLIVNAVQYLLEETEGIPKIYMIWFFICGVLFSPFRYIVLQILLMTSYPVQSGHAFFSSLLLLMYIPVVLGLLMGIGIALPQLFNFWVTGLIRSKFTSTIRLVISAVLMPILCIAGTYLFFLLLPVAGHSTHWLKAEDVIRASNGPSWIYYKYVGSYFMPIPTPPYSEEVGNDEKTTYRNHIASIYLSEKEHMRFIKYSYPDFYNRLPEIKDDLEGYSGAIQDLTKATEFNPQDAEAYYLQGVAKYDLGDYRGAIQDYNKAIKINPLYAEVYFNRGLVKAILKDYSDAIQDLTKTVEINPWDAEAYYNRGTVKGYLENYSGAIQDFTTAIEINPQYTEAYHNRGAVKGDLEDYSGAIQDFTKAIELNPQDAEAYYLRGFAKYSIMDINNACLDWRKAGELGLMEAYEAIRKYCN